ncbi:PhoH family protein [Candidatus Saccharibacteria bacterium]|nr:PhoH family protein [Candidatus Saccharibacteria bacterium]
MFHDFIVPGLDVLIGNPNILNPTPSPDERIEAKAKRLFIPRQYIDRLSEFSTEISTRGEAANILFGYLRRFPIQVNKVFTFYNGMEVQFTPFITLDHPSFDPKSSTEQAVMTARYLIGGLFRNGEVFTSLNITQDNLAIMTGSDRLAVHAALEGIHVASLNPEAYTGRRKLELPYEASSLWLSNRKITPCEFADIFPDAPPLHPNEYVEFTGDYSEFHDHSFRQVGRFDLEKDSLLPLHFTSIKHSLSTIYPRNAGQAMMLEALMLPSSTVPIVIVSGPFGTGKTFLSTAAALAQVANGTYERIFICPHDATLGAEVGFLPGDKTEKARANAQSFEDNLLTILRNHYRDLGAASSDPQKNGSPSARARSAIESMIKNGQLEFESIIRMDGRSLAETFYILDEFQDTERYQAKQLLGRAGEKTKVVALGDPTQTTNPHFNRYSNGLTWSMSKLAGDPAVAIVSLTIEEVTRSLAAITVAKRMK